MNSKANQEEINESTLKFLADQAPQKNNAQNSCSTRTKIKGNTKIYSSEETTYNLYLTTQELKKDDETNYNKQKEKLVELQG